jgi:hypothetical protein
MARPIRDIAERFWSHVDKRGSEECWPWLGYTWEGYGRFGITRGKNIKAHRFAYELANGPIPAGMDVLHKCDFCPCCNPNHLFAGTALDNITDARRKAHARGDGFGRHKLTPDQVQQIRELLSQGKTHEEIASRFGVTRGAISPIGRGLTWR